MSKMKYSYQTDRAVCSSRIDVEIEDGILRNATIVGGCAGNTQGVCRLAVGRPVDEVVKTLSGIRCGAKPTSCPDQLAKAIEEALRQNA